MRELSKHHETATMHMSILRAVIILTPAVMMSAITMDVYVPAIPRMTSLLETSHFKIQMTLTIFMVGMSLGQLVAGPLADKYGRRSLALASSLSYTVFSLGCALANNVEMLILMRLGESLSACGAIVASWAWVRDTFDDRTAPRVFSYLSATTGIAPIIAPIIGGYLLLWSDSWRSSFFFLTGWGLLSLTMVLYAWPESMPTKSQTPVRANLSSMINRYKSIFTNAEFLFHTFAGATAMNALFLFFSVSPVLLIEQLGIPEHRFGYYFAMTATLFLVVSLLCPFVREKLDTAYTLLIGFAFVILGSLFTFWWNYQFGLTSMGVILPTLVIYIGVALIMGPATAGGLKPFPQMAGTAAALFGFFQFGIPGVIGTFVMLEGVDTMNSFAVPMGSLGLIGLLWSLYRIYLKK